MKSILVVVLLLLPGLALAQGSGSGLPALYDVQGVDADDVLNVRSGPGTGFEIVGTLAPDATGIEVVGMSEDGRWLLLNSGEGAGWSAASFMARSGPDWSEGLPSELRCFGTEPFWSFNRSGESAEFSGLDLPTISYSETYVAPPSGFQPIEFGGVWQQGGGETATASIRRQSCNDGMSDQQYGLAITLIRTGGDRNGVFAGCCTLASR